MIPKFFPSLSDRRTPSRPVLSRSQDTATPDSTVPLMGVQSAPSSPHKSLATSVFPGETIALDLTSIAPPSGGEASLPSSRPLIGLVDLLAKIHRSLTWEEDKRREVIEFFKQNPTFFSDLSHFQKKDVVDPEWGNAFVNLNWLQALLRAQVPSSVLSEIFILFSQNSSKEQIATFVNHVGALGKRAFRYAVMCRSDLFSSSFKGSREEWAGKVTDMLLTLGVLVNAGAIVQKNHIELAGKMFSKVLENLKQSTQQSMLSHACQALCKQAVLFSAKLEMVKNMEDFSLFLTDGGFVDIFAPCLFQAALSERSGIGTCGVYKSLIDNAFYRSRAMHKKLLAQTFKTALENENNYLVGALFNEIYKHEETKAIIHELGIEKSFKNAVVFGKKDMVCALFSCLTKFQGEKTMQALVQEGFLEAVANGHGGVVTYLFSCFCPKKLPFITEELMKDAFSSVAFHGDKEMMTLLIKNINIYSIEDKTRKNSIEIMGKISREAEIAGHVAIVSFLLPYLALPQREEDPSSPVGTGF